MMPRRGSNRELRTRKDLLQAAGRLLKSGRRPSMEEVAAEALVSRATAYRHFSNVDALLVEVPVDEAVADPAALFAHDASTDAEARIDRAEAFMHDVTWRNEPQLRLMLANSIGRDTADDTLPRRQNRRLPLIEAALAPARARIGDADYGRLCTALALLFGPEAMIVARDVLRIDGRQARDAKSWAVRALVRAALDEGSSKSGGRKPAAATTQGRSGS
jgi:AcrR family transcriptional regulator